MHMRESHATFEQCQLLQHAHERITCDVRTVPTSTLIHSLDMQIKVREASYEHPLQIRAKGVTNGLAGGDGWITWKTMIARIFGAGW